MRWRCPWEGGGLAAAVAIWLSLTVPAGAQGAGDIRPLLSLPVACEIGATCFIQHYVDTDPGPGARDYACGGATYDSHNGTDFRLLSAAAAKLGVAVIAAAGGTVLRLRNGVADRFAREAGGGSLLKDRECGNGVVIDHGSGLETQYCHLLRDSLVVRPGQHVTVGTVLGRVGYSGLADFAHLHFTVRLAGRVVDPFTGAAPGATCRTGGSASADTLWERAAAARLAYHSTEIIQVAFAAAPPLHASLEHDHAAFEAPTPVGKALVAFGRIINLAPGDRVRITTHGPAGFGQVHTTMPVPRRQATFTALAGRRRSASTWPHGDYSAVFEVLRSSGVVARAATGLTLK